MLLCCHTTISYGRGGGATTTTERMWESMRKAVTGDRQKDKKRQLRQASRPNFHVQNREAQWAEEGCGNNYDTLTESQDWFLNIQKKFPHSVNRTKI